MTGKTSARDQAADLLAVLALDKGLIQVKSFDDRGQVRLFWYDSPAALLRDWPRLEATNAAGFGVYFGTATYNERKGTKDRAAWLWTVQADLDGKDYVKDKNDWRAGKSLALDMLANLPNALQPAALVDTGHGIHAYWPLRDPLPATAGNISAVERVNAALAAFLDSDPAVKDASRVLRLPGLTNNNCTWLETPEPLPVVLFGGIDGRRFEVADFQPIMPAKSTQARVIGGAGTATGRPGDDFNARGDWSELLAGHGWNKEGGRGDTSWWRRPGKSAGISARLNRGDDGLLYVYSSNAGALAAGQSYSLFGAYAALKHDGDFKEATKALAAAGYGQSSDNGNGPAVTFSSNDHRPAILEDADFQPATVDVLDLPQAARLPDNLGADVAGWLGDYVAYASEVSERTPAIIHQAAGLYLASVAVARRLVLPMRHADIFPNLYILAVAPTTLYAKTTGLGVMNSLLDDGIPHLQLSNESTPEALLAELAGREPPNLDSKEISDAEREIWKQGQRFAAQRGLVLEEASALLAGMRREYMLGMAELLLRLYDCPRLYRRHTRGGGYAMIRHAYMTFCGWTTPARLRTAEIETGWQDGLFARFALVTPTEAPQRPADDGYTKSRPQRPPVLLEELTRLANGLLPTPDEFPKPVNARAMGIADDARAAWYRYYQATSYDLLTSGQAPDARLHGTYGRLSTAALKVAMLLAALDWSRSGGAGDPLVTLGHYAAAQRIAEDWRASAHRLLNTLSAKTEAEEEDRDLRRLLGVMERSAGQWLAVRDVVRCLPSKQYTTAVVSSLLRILVEDGRIEAAEHKPEGRGRPSTRYRIVSM
mgnify:CR=1 FL=1